MKIGLVYNRREVFFVLSGKRIYFARFLVPSSFHSSVHLHFPPIIRGLHNSRGFFNLFLFTLTLAYYTHAKFWMGFKGKDLTKASI